MWIVATVLLAMALLVLVVSTRRRTSEHFELATKILSDAGYEGVPPQDLDGALGRIDAVLGTTDERVPAGPLGPLGPSAIVALDHLSTGVVVASVDGDIIIRNEAAEPYASGRHGDALVEREIQSRLSDALRGESSDEQLELHGPPERVLLVVGSPLMRAGEQIGAIVLIDDVSEQRRLDAVRRDFVANVSHELRTPVGALSLLAETLEGEEDPAVAKRLGDRMQGEAERLTHLIDDLLDLSRIEGSSTERHESIDVGSVVNEAAAAIRSAAEAAGVRVTVEIEDVPPMLGDRSQLVSAVTNLFENAVKYTDEGGSVIGRLVSHGDEVAIAVVDTGIGIPQKDTTRIFERFYRVDRGRSSTSGGTGLGLAIVRHVTVNHGGRVEVVSHEGQGSTFTLIFPAATTSNLEKESA